MTSLVVDASVVVKWFIPEVHAVAAQKFVDPRLRLFAPDLLGPELGSVLWKKRLRQQLSSRAARQILLDFQRYRVRLVPSKPFLLAAFDLADRIGRSVYDCLYLVLAQRLHCRVVTADERLFNAIRNDPVSAHVLWIEDEP